MRLINGVETDLISASDRGLQYGDGLFETILCVHREPLELDRHIQRLFDASIKLKIPLPIQQDLVDQIHRVCDAIGNGVVKIILTRGSSDRGYRAVDQDRSTIIVQGLANIPKPPDYRALSFLSETFYRPDPLSCFKTLNKLRHVMAEFELATRNCYEGVWCDQNDFVVEGNRSNLFVLLEDGWVTPDLSPGGLAGVMRDCILNWAASENIPLCVRDITRQEMSQARGICVANSVIGMLDVHCIDEIRMSPDAAGDVLLDLVRDNYKAKH